MRTGDGNFKRLCRQIAFWMLLPVLLVSAIPQGFMPGVQEDGHFTVVLCTADGFRTVTLDENGHEVPGPNQTDTRTHHCVFSVLTGLALPVIPAIFQRQASQPDVVSYHGPGIALLAQSPGALGARAPPSRV
ncbi:hypothetical protein E1180_08625 [Roseibium denhamense]|uniref:DUF2946 family protein n=1 Tax=Roseibium denhamense TaxID=76305 RepID=UPI0018AD1E9C|nr:DUF2946 family protein [Roseibium denhamense]MTI05580.1 hypothetical protein [Roseibium denhamense]